MFYICYMSKFYHKYYDWNLTNNHFWSVLAQNCLPNWIIYRWIQIYVTVFQFLWINFRNCSSKVRNTHHHHLTNFYVFHLYLFIYLYNFLILKSLFYFQYNHLFVICFTCLNRRTSYISNTYIVFYICQTSGDDSIFYICDFLVFQFS